MSEILLTYLLMESRKQQFPSLCLLFELCHPVIKRNMAELKGKTKQHRLIKIFGGERCEVRSTKKDSLLGHELQEDITASALALTRRLQRKRRRIGHSWNPPSPACSIGIKAVGNGNHSCSCIFWPGTGKADKKTKSVLQGIRNRMYRSGTS